MLQMQAHFQSSLPIHHLQRKIIYRLLDFRRRQVARAGKHSSQIINSSNTVMQKGQGEDTTVTWEDQQNINTFGRLNSQLHELEDEIKAKQKAAEDLEDAENELILTDEEEIRYLIGEVFIHTPKDDVEGLLEQLTENNRKEMDELIAEKERISDKLAELKGILYGKFKDQINLEED